jgi:uroporphyrin-III C-methyltransferase
MVYLIGAGPGDPDLITVAGMKALQSCTAVIFDALANEALLEYAPRNALKFGMGKRGYAPSTSQHEINQKMIELARGGHIVARLKGGDPFVFARAGEEMRALAHAGIVFKVIAGVSSVTAAAAAALIPLTFRGLASSFTVISANQMDNGKETDWKAVAHVDTLVILMGGARLNSISKSLCEHGRTIDTPVAIIQSATLSNERVVYCSLGSLADEAVRANLQPPLIIMIGEVARIGKAFSLATRSTS